MNHDTDANSDGAPDADDRFIGKRRPIRSLPGPRTGKPPAALGPPSPILREDGPERTPASEISVSPAELYVTVEIPGASRDSIEVTAMDRHLTIRAARSKGPSYTLELDLPVRVETESAKVTYRNGVLDVTLSRSLSSGGANDVE